MSSSNEREDIISNLRGKSFTLIEACEIESRLCKYITPLYNDRIWLNKKTCEEISIGCANYK